VPVLRGLLLELQDERVSASYVLNLSVKDIGKPQ
jgi:hypothetical protein